MQLTEELVRALDEEADRRGVSRSLIIRNAVVAFLEDAQRDLLGVHIADGYRRIPPGVPDEWGDLEAVADRSFREVSQRLDAEELRPGRLRGSAW